METNSASPAPAPRPKWPWVTILILQIIQVLSLIPWLMVAGLAVMAFDSPGSAQRWEPWAFVLTIWSYPFWLLAGGVGSWVLFSFRHYKSAAALAVLLALPIPTLFAIVFASSLMS